MATDSSPRIPDQRVNVAVYMATNRALWGAADDAVGGAVYMSLYVDIGRAVFDALEEVHRGH